MAYSELIKDFERIRAYMQDFYVYGFKTRSEYDRKSARSYDDERRRIESWLGDHVQSAMTPEGKNLFLSIDSRRFQRNPLFRAWKSRSTPVWESSRQKSRDGKCATADRRILTFLPWGMFWTSSVKPPPAV